PRRGAASTPSTPAWGSSSGPAGPRPRSGSGSPPRSPRGDSRTRSSSSWAPAPTAPIRTTTSPTGRSDAATPSPPTSAGRWTPAGLGELFIHRTGHGIGLGLHEPPFVTAGADTVLEEGMSFSVEPGIYRSGEWGARLEDIVAVTADGHRALNSGERGLRLLSE